MLVPASHKRSFYQLVSGNVLRPGRTLPEEKDKDGGYTGLSSVERRCALLAMTAIDLGLGLEVARTWLAEAAASYVDLQRRTGRSTGFKALRTTFRIGTCHDGEMLASWSRDYLQTPYGSDRNKANTPPENHYWHFAHLLALFHAGEGARLDAMIEDLLVLGPCKGFPHAAEWFDAMRALAIEALTASHPRLEGKLAAVAEVNQERFAPKRSEGFHEAWFAELAMAFVPAAQQRGWTIDNDTPHPSMPLALFQLAPRKVVVRPWSELAGLTPGDDVAAAISEAAKATPQKKAGAKTKKTTSPKKTKAKKSAAKA